MTSTRTSSGIPCVRVRDVRAALPYYTDTLGFETVTLLGGTHPSFALVAGHGAMLLLQQADAEPRQDRPTGPPWDAVLLVDDVTAARQELQARGAASLSEVTDRGMGWPSFELADHDGNLICVGQSVEHFARRRRPTTPSPLIRLRAWSRDTRARLQERPHLAEFRAFYERLERTEDTFYMFFTSGLLHWVAQAESFVPPDVNLVLLGSALTEDEQEWIRRNLARPFHHIRLPIDDITAWEFLFAANRHDFGWLDIDCFVLNPELFKEMTRLDPAVSMNCTWSWDTGHGFHLANTHLLYVNAAAIRAVAEQEVEASPSTYDWTGSRRKYPHRTCYMKIPTPRQCELMLEVLPEDGPGKPPLLAGASYYNTMVVYQLLARAAGFPVHRVRPLTRRCHVPTDANSTDPEHWPEDMSDELFHLFGVSYYKHFHFEPGIRALYLAAEHVMLENVIDLLPGRYSADLKRVAGQLTELGVAPKDARDLFAHHLTAAREVSAAAVEQLLRPNARPAGRAAP